MVISYYYNVVGIVTFKENKTSDMVSVFDIKICFVLVFLAHQHMFLTGCNDYDFQALCQVYLFLQIRHTTYFLYDKCLALLIAFPCKDLIFIYYVFFCRINNMVHIYPH